MREINSFEETGERGNLCRLRSLEFVEVQTYFGGVTLPDKALFTVKEAQAHLGLGKTSIYALIKDGLLARWGLGGLAARRLRDPNLCSQR